MRARTKPEIEEVDSDMTPMIDVVFQLLIFFMVATKFKTLEGKLLAYLPKKDGLHDVNTPPPTVLPIRVTLHYDTATRQAKIYVGQTFTGIADQGGMRRALERVRAIKAAGTDEAEIDAAPGLPYRYVVDTLDMLMGVRLKSIKFAAGTF